MEFRRSIIVLTLLLCACAVHAQDPVRYNELVDKAWALYESGDYLESAKSYTAAFRVLGDRGAVVDRYNAACSWSLSGEVDSAFVQLLRIATKGGYKDYGHLVADTDLNNLHNDPRWEEVKDLVKANKAEAEKYLDQDLVAILDTVMQDDQKYRMQVREVQDKYGPGSEEMQELISNMMRTDSINTIKVSRILDEYGWLGPEVVGESGNSALFLVIQHSDLETQQKYLPMMRKAVADGKARGSSLALLEDRVALREGEMQIYGSQIGSNPETGEMYVLPLRDASTVDQRRASVGLGPLSEYVSRWGIEWDPEEYIKRLPEYQSWQR